VRMQNGDTPVTAVAVVKTPGGVELRLDLAQQEKIFGLMESTTDRLNRRGERWERERGFFFTSQGYGMHLRAPTRGIFDLARGTVETPGAQSIDYVFYYGPTAKEILEQHSNVIGETEV